MTDGGVALRLQAGHVGVLRALMKASMMGCEFGRNRYSVHQGARWLKSDWTMGYQLGMMPW